MAGTVYHAPVSEPTRTIWSARRKLLGNLIPALFWLPPNVAGVFLIVRSGDPFGPGVWLLLAGLVTGWIALNLFGFFENELMRRELTEFLAPTGLKLDGAEFVGFSTPAHGGVIDAHEDVGMLILDADTLIFVSQTRTVKILRSQVDAVRFRHNVHSLVGLGRWISIEGHLPTGPMRMLIESRAKPTLLRSRKHGTLLKSRLAAWAEAKG